MSTRTRSAAHAERGRRTKGEASKAEKRLAVKPRSAKKSAPARRPVEPPELRLAIGEHVASVRRASGQTQEQVSTQLGRRKSWLAKIERGQRSLLFSEAIELSDLLGVEIAQFWPEVIP